MDHRIKMKVTLVQDGELDYFVKLLADRYFPRKGHENGSRSAALRYCIEYGFAREKSAGMILTSWSDLPPTRLGQWVKVYHNIESVAYTVYLTVQRGDDMDYLARAKVFDKDKTGKRTRVYKYPKFCGLKRNVVAQCIKVFVNDVTQYAIESGEPLLSLRQLENYYKIKVKKDGEE